MKHIQKNSEPNSLVEYRNKEFTSYGDMDSDVKEILKDSLLTEQGYICCYCMKRINKNNMKIEHYKPQTIFPELALNYKNMLAACNGNEGKAYHLQHCDTYKGNNEITVNPYLESCMNTIRYLDNGTIISTTQVYKNDIDAKLNLNNQSIRNNRKSVIDEVIRFLSSKYPNKQWTKANINRFIHKWNSKNEDGKYKEYCDVALYKLNYFYTKAQI